MVTAASAPLSDADGETLRDALARSEERYALLTRAASEGVYEWNIASGDLYVSDRLNEMFQFREGELRPSDWNDRIHADDHETYKRALVAHFKSVTARLRCEYRIRDRSGAYRWVLDNGIAVRDAGDRAVRLVGVINDITERRAREAEIAAKTSILEATLENMDQGISMVDSELNVIAFNQRFLELLGFPKSEFKTGFHMSQAFRYNARRGEYGPGEIETLVEQRLALARKFEAHQFERTRPDGTILEIRGAPLPDRTGFVTTYRDITQRKRAEEELRRQNERLRQEVEAHNRSKATIEYLVDEIKSGQNFEHIVGKSELLLSALDRLGQVAATDSTVLIQGETGTGKELFVRAIHDRSARKNRPLVKVNCAALPRDLVESELFGHERGAFTGATQQRKGRFELADKGTIFLDEIGELPLEAQAKLLRVLQEHEYERVGGEKSLKTDVRVIGATNRDLSLEVKEGRFRSDLYYRLSVFPLTIPPLRERRDDVPLLAQHFVQRFARKLGRRFEEIAPDFLAKLEVYRWPGNVRELENVIERAAILSPGPVLRSTEAFDSTAASHTVERRAPEMPLLPLDELERQHILRVLGHTRGVIEGDAGAAALLGLNPSTLRGRMRKLGIKKPA